MKKMYITPAISMEDIEMAEIICTSVIGPGQPNTPPGARNHRNIWEEDEDLDYEGNTSGSVW